MEARKSRTGIGYCPACERYIGAESVCPFCECDQPGSRALRFIRWCSMFLAVAGLALLAWRVHASEAPLVSVGELHGGMNHAFVRICGTVEQDPYMREDDSGYCSISIHDGSGSIRAICYGRVARNLEREGRIPKQGDRLEVQGTLDIRGNGNCRLLVPTDEAVKLWN